MAYLEIRVLQSLIHLNSLLWTESEAFLKEIDRKRVRSREERVERTLLAEGQRTDVLSRSRGRDRVEVVERWSTENIEDDRKLMMVCVEQKKQMR